MSKPSFEKIPVDAIEATAATQVRVRLDRSVIDQYTEDFQNGAAFPPLDVFREPNSQRVILADGFHRHRAAINAGREEIGCNVHEGSMIDALMFALGSNAEHGFRRTNADKRHAVEMALKDPEISQLTQQEIADICRVHRRTVIRMINDGLSKDDGDDDNVTKSHSDKVKEHDGSDIRDNGAEPTQADVETEELRSALKMITVLPYPGEDAPERLNLDKDLVADCEYVSTWLASLVITARKPQEDDDGDDS